MTFKEFSDKFKKARGNKGAEEVFNYLATPETIHNMIIFSEMEYPAISGIAAILEARFNNHPDFPMGDFQNRQLVGRMVKYILDDFGYTPIKTGLNDTQIKAFTRATQFKTASIYAKTKTAVKHLVLKVE